MPVLILSISMYVHILKSLSNKRMDERLRVGQRRLANSQIVTLDVEIQQVHPFYLFQGQAEQPGRVRDFFLRCLLWYIIGVPVKIGCLISGHGESSCRDLRSDSHLLVKELWFALLTTRGRAARTTAWSRRITGGDDTARRLESYDHPNDITAVAAELVKRTRI